MTRKRRWHHSSDQQVQQGRARDGDKVGNKHLPNQQQQQQQLATASFFIIKFSFFKHQQASV